MTPRTPLAIIITKVTTVSEAKNAHDEKIQWKARELNMTAHEAM
jgi:hypothetical protein